MITITSCPKGHTKELDKAVSPADTVARVRERLAALEATGVRILTETRRADVGRLGIPVFMSVVGKSAGAVLPTRKQMGKGASEAQAEASAVMELMERFGFFTYWKKEPAARLTWSQAKERFGEALLPSAAIIKSVGDRVSVAQAEAMLNLLQWDFRPATDLTHGREVFAPLGWFRKLGEFNGSSAGNTAEESLLQGLCELIERHVCALIAKDRPTLPTVDTRTIDSPVLADLVKRFADNGIALVLKDFSLGMPVPTIGALAWDPATFPGRSEIVFTAGTASSPEKAAIRAVTEVAQLAGDFITGACYEASGLPKFSGLEETAWLLEGPSVVLEALPSAELPDIADELRAVVSGLAAKGITTYAVETTSAVTQVPSHYSFAPGLAFRERDANASIGLFVGRILAEEEEDPEKARAGLTLIDSIYGGLHSTPFFRGLVSLREGDIASAKKHFATALPEQPDDDSFALAAFYLGYACTLKEEWAEALPHLAAARDRCPDMKEYHNLRGVALFKLKRYAEAAEDFGYVLTRLDKGSVTDIANLGLCHKFMGHADKARHYLTAALELDPNHEAACKHLAELETPPNA